MAPNLLILNSHSALNTGEGAIVLAEIGLARSVWPDSRITLTSRTPEIDRRIYAASNVEVISPLSPAPVAYSGPAAKIFGTAAEGLAWKSKLVFFRALRDADLVLATGGGVLYTDRRLFAGLTFRQSLWQIAAAQKAGKPVVFLPQSIGPFANRRAARAWRRRLKHPATRTIFAREEASLAVLRGLLRETSAESRIEFCPDTVLALKPSPAPGPKADFSGLESLPRPRLAVCLRPWGFPELRGFAARSAARAGYVAAVAEASIDFVRRRKGSLLVVPFVRGPAGKDSDRGLSADFFARIRDSIPDERRRFLDLPAEASPFDFLDLFRRVEVTLAARLHAAVLSLIAGTAAVAVGYQPKSRGLMDLLGLGSFCLDISALSGPALGFALSRAADGDGYGHLPSRLAECRADVESKIARALGAAGPPESR
jgi:colanic acid/amylovoran biosynthesis protein